MVWDLYIYSIINLRLVMIATMVRRVLVQAFFANVIGMKGLHNCVMLHNVDCKNLFNRSDCVYIFVKGKCEIHFFR